MTRETPFWPAAMPLHQAAAYCGLSVRRIAYLAGTGTLNTRQSDSQETLIATDDIERLSTTVVNIRKTIEDDPNFLLSLPIEWADCSGVYFVAAGDRVKIGFGKSIPKRVASLQTSCPEEMRLVYWEPGDWSTEAKYHSRFKTRRLRGEWFSLQLDLQYFLRQKTCDFWEVDTHGGILSRPAPESFWPVDNRNNGENV